MFERVLLAGSIMVLAPAAWAQTATLTETEVGEEIVTLPEEGERFVFRNAAGGSVTFYGQFNPTYQSFDDGEDTTDGLVDNGNWNSRLGFRIVQPLNDATLRLRFETGLGLRNSALISQIDRPDWIDWDRNSLRWFEAAFDTSYGTFSFGQGSSASDGTAGQDESFTFVAGATDASDGFGSFQFRDSTGSLTGVTVGQVNNSFDGARRFRFRYDTPDFNGFVLSTSYGINVLNENDDADYYDIAMRWTGDLGDVSIQTAIGYGWEDDPDAPDRERLAGSATAFHNPTGLNLNVSAGRLIDGPKYGSIKGGWRADLFPVGLTSLSVDYYNGEDFLSSGARTENYGFGAVQSFDDLSLDIYAGVRRFTYSDRSGRSYQDATGLLLGARWFF